MLWLMCDKAPVQRPVCFAVSDVHPGTERLKEITIRSALERTAQTTLLTCSNPDEKVAEGGDFHPLIAAAALAYQKHYPLALTPDVLWLTILQGVAQHIANHSGVLQARLVTHQTKMELVVQTGLGSLPKTDAEMMAATQPFVDLIEQHVLPEKRFVLNTKFSTTTDVERIAGAIVVMDAFQPYFDYVFYIICGIPSITLEGTTEDWKLLASKVQLLNDSDLDLGWWTKELLPLCDHFVHASRGDVDRSHWKNLCKLVERYGANDLNGWLLKFIPYVRRDRNELPVHRNPVLALTNFDVKTGPQERFTISGCTSNMLPTGVSRVPVTCKNISSGASVSLQFLAGLVGVAQSPEDFTVKPVAGWGIANQSGIDRLIDLLQTRHGCVAPSKIDTEKVIESLGGCLPGDMWKFHSEIEFASLTYPQPNEHGETGCTIRTHAGIAALWDSRSINGELESLHEQGEISATFLAERKRFISDYGDLRVIAEAPRGKRTVFYVFGQLQDSDALIFRWTGKRAPDAFTPVAKTFSEWLATVLRSADSSD
jgi:hypothetical protein